MLSSARFVDSSSAPTNVPLPFLLMNVGSSSFTNARSSSQLKVILGSCMDDTEAVVMKRKPRNQTKAFKILGKFLSGSSSGVSEKQVGLQISGNTGWAI